MKRWSRIQGNIWQADYDRVLALSDEECCYSLTQQEVAMILSQTPYFEWKTRWYSDIDTPINQDVIQTLKDNLEFKLMSGCCPDGGLLGRYTSSGVYQTSPDGDVWTDNPEADPRNDWTEAPPLPGEDGDGKRCAAADNIETQFKQWRDDLEPLLDAGSIITAIVAGLVGFVGTVVFASVVGTAWGVLLLGLAAALFQAGSVGLAAELTDEVMDAFKCLVYCNLGEDGQFTEAQIDQLLTDIASEFDGLAEVFFYSIVSTMRTTGMNNTGTLGSATAADCGDCGCGSDCGTKYDVREPYTSPTYGTVVDRGPLFVTVEIGTSGYAAILAEDYNDCCRVGAITVLTGSATAAAHIPCGTPYSEGAYIFSSGLTACCSVLFMTGTSGSTIRYDFSDDC